jgi:hypothetical protein
MPGRQEPLHITITALPANEAGRHSVTGIWLDSTNIYRELGDEEDGVFFGLYSETNSTSEGSGNISRRNSLFHQISC